MAKYAIVASYNTADPNRYKRQSAMDFIAEQMHSFILCDSFDEAVTKMLEDCADFLPRDWQAVWSISEAIEEELIEGDEADIEAINGIEIQFNKMLEDKKAYYVDTHNMSFVCDCTVENDNDYFDVINNNELIYRQMIGENYYRTVRTNILKMDNPKHEYFVEVIDINSNVVGDKVTGCFASVRLIPIED